MYLLALGILLLALKYLEIGTVATWPWWQVFIPFGLAALWWAWADWSGYTKRKAMERLEKRKKERQEKNKAALGIRRRP